MTTSSDTADLDNVTEALTGGRLLLRHCMDCGEKHHYPRSYCPSCGSGELTWIEATGRGTLYSFTRWKKADKTVFPILVSLEEGPLVQAMLDGEGNGIEIGMPVQLAPRQDAAPLAMFTTN